MKDRIYYLILNFYNIHSPKNKYYKKFIFDEKFPQLKNDFYFEDINYEKLYKAIAKEDWNKMRDILIDIRLPHEILKKL